MSDELFEEGGPLNIRRSGPDEYQMSIELPTDEDGMLGRECPDADCSPGYFKVKPGTGITEGHQVAFCPYCGTSGDPGEFATKSQRDYAIGLVEREAIKGVNQMIKRALGLGPSGRKKIGGDFLSIEISYKPTRLGPVPRPIEEELRRDVLCPHCGLEHAVFGLATWCPDCGEDIFLAHVDKEMEVVEKIISAVDSRRAKLGARVAARDIENALEDLVSIFEAVLKIITLRFLREQGVNQEEAAQILEKKIRNKYQSIFSAMTTFQEYIGVDLFDGISDGDIAFLRATFEKRHPITHNLGVVDRKYLERARTGELEGREVRVTAQEVERAADITRRVLSHAYQRVFQSGDSQSTAG